MPIRFPAIYHLGMVGVCEALDQVTSGICNGLHARSPTSARKPSITVPVLIPPLTGLDTDGLSDMR